MATPEVYSLRNGPLLTRPLLLFLSLIVGLAALLSLAWFMYFLIHSSEMSLEDSQRTHMLDFVRIKRQEEAARKDRRPERPEMNEIPDAPEMDQSTSPRAQLSVSAPAPVDMDLAIGSGVSTGDGGYLPIIKVAPVYPRNALATGVSGDCLVRYTVTTAGTVKDVEVVKEQCPVVAFRRASIEAAKRFKYKPKVVDGEPVEVHGVSNMFHFQWQWDEDMDREKL